MEKEKVKILVVVKTYPNISSKYNEVVCTAGITDDAKWIRLYPVPYRYQPQSKKYGKFQWIEVEVERQKEDPRQESYRPNLDTLTVLEKPIDTKNYWLKRKEIVLPLLAKSIESLQITIKNKEEPGNSIGVIKPKKINKFIVEDVAREWTSKQKAILKQQDLFGEKIKDLDKIPYKFSYQFECDDEKCKGHKLMIEDWEICELYRKCLFDYKSEKKAVDKVREKYEGFIKNNDVYLVVGTTKKDHFCGTFVIISVFSPLKEKEPLNLPLF